MLRRILRLAAVVAGAAIVLGVGYVVMFALFCCRESPNWGRGVDIVNAADMTVEVLWRREDDAFAHRPALPTATASPASAAP